MKNILLLVSLSFQLNFSLLFSGEVSLVGKVKLEESDIKNLSPFLEVSQISKSGKFTIANFIDGSRDSIVMDSNGRYIRFKQADSSSKLSTNILGTIVENGILKVIQIEKQEFIGETNDGLAIFNTFSTNGYLSVVNQRISLSEQKFKISATSKDLIDSVGTSFNKVKITKYDSSGKILRTSSFDGKLPEISDESDGGPDINFQIFVNIEDGYICLYRIDFNEAMISNNATRFNVKSSKGNTITAQLLSESQKILRIQSSTNLIDWNTFKTIQNEPSLELVIPANKPKEFIRAIE
jgi:hypothetical protein